ncbi:MAG: YMGG-like glycine zipper-containing protein [Melioribacteraceae bacterium]|nr:YMGG-like glycine zipper-containing protein [Melioribacteraceae bacterium]
MKLVIEKLKYLSTYLSLNFTMMMLILPIMILTIRCSTPTYTVGERESDNITYEKLNQYLIDESVEIILKNEKTIEVENVSIRPPMLKFQISNLEDNLTDSVHLSEINYLIISDNSKLWGTIGGAMVGASIGSIVGKKKDEEKWSLIPKANETGYGLVGGLIGALLGYAIGNQISKEFYPSSGRYIILEENQDSLSLRKVVQ